MRKAQVGLVAALALLATGLAPSRAPTFATLTGEYCGTVPGLDERSNYVHYTVPMELSLSPDGAYSASLSRPGSAPLRTISGKSSLAGDTLRLRPGLVRSVGPKGPAEVTPVELKVVRWGERVYLVPAESLAEFCRTKPEFLDTCPFWSLVRTEHLKRPRPSWPPCS